MEFIDTQLACWDQLSESWREWLNFEYWNTCGRDEDMFFFVSGYRSPKF